MTTSSLSSSTGVFANPHSNNQLPYDILHLIFKYATEIDTQYIWRTWKELLPLAAICSQWRRSAIHFVYQYAYVLEDRGKERKPVIDTNLSLFTSDEYTALAKEIYITSKFQPSFTHLVGVYSDLFLFDKNRWPNVHSLLVSSDRSLRIMMPAALEKMYSSMDNEFVVFAQDICKNIPAMKKLYLNFGTPAVIDAVVAKRLLDSSSIHRLNTLDCSFPIALDSNLEFSGVTNLVLRLSQNTQMVLPKLNLDILTKLTLTDVPKTMPWEMFTCDKNAARIEFKRLTFLKLVFSHAQNNLHAAMLTTSTDVTTYRKVTLALPVLDTFCLIHMPVEVIANVTFEFSKRFRKFSYFGKFRQIEHIHKWGIGSISKILLALTDVNSHDEDDFYRITNSFFKSNTHKRSRLSLHSYSFNLDFTRIDWSYLTQLHIAKEYTYEMLVNLLTNLKCLNYLAAFNLKLDDFPALTLEHIKYKTPDKIDGSPINTSLVTLSALVSSSNIYATPDHYTIIYYIALRLPGVKFVIMSDVIFDASTFVAKYGDLYPHIKSVIFKY